ncbi:MAG: PadR family transcriptional regulator [Longimicrobiales bacterium]
MPDTLAVVKGTLDVLVLKALSWQPMHGFELTRWLERQSAQRLELEDAALYQALYRLEKRGLVRAEWGVTEQNRRARYYQVTARGEAYLVEQTEWWLRYAEVVTEILMHSPRRA